MWVITTSSPTLKDFDFSNFGPDLEFLWKLKRWFILKNARFLDLLQEILDLMGGKDHFFIASAFPHFILAEILFAFISKTISAISQLFKKNYTFFLISKMLS